MENGPTGREWGSLTREVEEIRHDLRNMKMVVDAQSEMIRDVENRHRRLDTKIYTTVTVVVSVATVVGFALQMIFG